MTLLTDKQLEELVKASAAAIAAYHGGEENEDDEAHVQLALTAALPVIERAVLERAAKADKRECPITPTVGTGALHSEQQYCFEQGWNAGRKSMRKAIRALAGEVG
jgi:hypothetical protein